MHVLRTALLWGGCLMGLASGLRSASAQTDAQRVPPFSPPQAPRISHAVGVDYGSFQYLSPGLPISAGGASVYYRGRLRIGIALSAGLRFLHVDRAPAGFAFEGFVGAQLAPIVGPWRPLAGIEIGGTSLVSESLQTEPNYSPEEYTPRLHPLGPVYAGFVIAPLRFAVWHFVFQGGGVQIATHLPQFGNAVRLQLLFAQLEWSF
ncbi:MAG TPA: hypothetical protein PKI03_09865 [Pseudomonadota bacterium]|nr:hypothetical protein [Pseudomonadota bacterium]